MSKPPKIFSQRKKTSRWNWDYWSDKQDKTMYKVIAQFKGKWSTKPIFTKENFYLGSNPMTKAQQEHWGLKLEDRFKESWIAKEQKKDYDPILHATGLKDPVCWIHVQMPGQMHLLHMDNARADNLHKSKSRKSLTLEQRRKKIARVFIMLDDWYPGQIIMLGNYHWVKWKKGDTMYFSWSDLPHATANLGHDPRPMLFVQGEITDKFKAMLKSKKKLTIKI